jgi:hypothetical protein
VFRPATCVARKRFAANQRTSHVSSAPSMEQIVISLLFRIKGSQGDRLGKRFDGVSQMNDHVLIMNRHKHVEELERRLRSMEALLESPGRINRGRIEQVSQSGFGRLGLKRKAASQELGGSDRSYRSGPTMGTTLETPKHGIAERSSGIEDLNTSLETGMTKSIT